MSAIRILIADDHMLFRDGLHRILETDPALEVVGMAASKELAVQAITRPSVLAETRHWQMLCP